MTAKKPRKVCPCCGQEVELDPVALGGVGIMWRCANCWAPFDAKAARALPEHATNGVPEAAAARRRINEEIFNAISPTI